MATFIIDEKEYDLKLTYESVKRLNKAFDGGSLEIIGLALSGDLDAFPIVLHAGLLHTGEKFTQKKVNEAIEKAFEDESLSLDAIQKIMNEVVTDSFFYRPTVAKLIAKNPELKTALDSLLG